MIVVHGLAFQWLHVLSSIVFMNRSLFSECTVLFVVFIFNFNVYTNDQIKANDNPVEFSGDFEKFLNDLGSILNKSKNHPVSETKHDVFTKTTPRTWGSSSKVFKSQKDALNDVLMMKLVSYYEDKYRLALHEPPTAQITNPSNHFDHTKPKKYSVLDVINQEDNNYEKTTKVDEPHSDLHQLFNYVDNTRSSDVTNQNANQAMASRPDQVEEVINVMEDLSPNIGRQNTLDNRFPIAERIHNIGEYTSPNVVNVPDDVNYNVMNIAKMQIPEFVLPSIGNVQNVHDNTNPNYDEGRVVDYNNPNFERPRNIQEERPTTRTRVRYNEENKFTNHKRVPNIEYTNPNNYNTRNILNDGLTRFRLRTTVGDRPQNNGDIQNLSGNGSPEVARVRNTLDNRFSKIEREGTHKDRSPNGEKEQNMDSTRPNIESLRIIIGTSPIEKSTVNLRKNNNDNPISEVIVL